MPRPQDLDPTLAELDERLRTALVAAGLPPADPGFERPRDPAHGDWASTMALRLAKPAGRPPREIARAVVDALDPPASVEAVEIAGPGFLNFRLTAARQGEVVTRVLADPSYGRVTLATPETVDVEFVSANPTGPLHAGAGRWAATGDAIAELLAARGHRVVREYYVNDAGEQVRRLGESVVLRARGEELGEQHYQGTYVVELAGELAPRGSFDDLGGSSGVALGGGGAGHAPDGALVEDAEASRDARVEPDLADRVGLAAVAAMRARIAATLRRMGVEYDVWFSERERLHETGAIDAALAELDDRGQTYVDEGAVFLRTSDHGDDKDRVLVRSDGRPTYFAADAAYLRDKWARADRLVYLLGADHHGYVARLRALAACYGIPDDRVEIPIGQLVNLLRSGEPVKMSKRSGEFVTLDEVVDEVGVDVARYHFLRSSLDTTIDFDLADVTAQSMENPVYYVQYAHARIASILRTADERGFDPGAVSDADLTLLTHPAEVELLRGLQALPQVVAEAATLRATQRLTRYVEDLAGSFHRFYTECRVLTDRALPDEEGAVDPDAVALGAARYHLAAAAKQVLATALGLLRVAAPERM